MKKIIVALIVALLILPAVAFAQQSEWETFMKHQRDERAAFNNQIRQEKEAFLKSHPDVVAWMEAESKAAQARAQQQRQARDMKRKNRMLTPAPVITPAAPVKKPVAKPVPEFLGPPVQVNGQSDK